MSLNQAQVREELKPRPTWPNICFQIVHDRDKFNNCKQSETN